MKRKILITAPHLNIGGGGVANYYRSLKRHFTDDVHIYFVGSKGIGENIYNKPINLIRDLSGLWLHLLRAGRNYDLVHINPSFVPYSIVRDGFILRLSKMFNKKCIVFFRGWNKSYSEKVVKRYYKIFFLTYNKADSFIVLSSEFKDKLRDWGFRQPIYIETTAVDDALVSNFRMKDRKDSFASQKEINLLFLSRIEKEKGIVETIEATKILADSHPNIRLLVGGTGSYLEAAKRRALDIGISSKVFFEGYVSGKQKTEMFKKSLIFVFPTYHGEGMPNCVLESMAFGIPVITRPVGGIKDFFIDGKFGFLTESKKPEAFANLILKLINNENLWADMSLRSYEYAHERFLASKVAKRIENIYSEVVANTFF